ncbi:MAG: late competence development ComFB family protein [Pseudanabaenaceae cyanobacterium]
MTICRNVMEELVVAEAKVQMARLEPRVQEQIRLADVAAYALNQLPLFYATNQRGWDKQRQRAQAECGRQISTVVRQAIVNATNAPLRNPEPLPSGDLISPEQSLFRIQERCNQKNLHWRDVPRAVAAAIVDAKQKPQAQLEEEVAVGTGGRRMAEGIKAYLQRAKHAVPKAKKEEEDRDFAVYMLRASYGFVNILEFQVLRVAQKQIARLPPAAAKRVVLEEVAAYALNRLPPMYATSARGAKELKLRLRTELAQEVIAKVREGILQLSQLPLRHFLPDPFAQFTEEQEAAIAALRKSLGREDLTWYNAPAAIAEVLQQTREGESKWYCMVQTGEF